MTIRTISLVATLVAAISLAACAERSHPSGMMGGGMMGNGMMADGTKQADCSKMQMKRAGKMPMAGNTTGGENVSGKGMAPMDGCPKMGAMKGGASAKPEAKPSDPEDHSAHHPPS